MGFNLVSLGTLDESLAHPREILLPVLLKNAKGFCLIHNHPSGSLEPSGSDRALTRRLKEASDLLRLEFCDHVIVNSNPEGTCSEASDYWSFREHGFI